MFSYNLFIVFCLAIIFICIGLYILYILHVEQKTKKPKNEKEEESFLYDLSFEDISELFDYDNSISYIRAFLFYDYNDDNNNLFIDVGLQVHFLAYDIYEIKKEHPFDYEKFIDIEDIKLIIEKYNFLLTIQIKRFSLFKEKLVLYSNKNLKNKKLFNSYYEDLCSLEEINEFILPDLEYYFVKENMIELKSLVKECNDLFNNIKRTIE